MDTKDLFNETFFLYFENEIKSFHDLFKNNHLKGELLEELIVNALRKSNINCDWDCYSHNSKYDIKINGVEVSVKSGKVDSKNRLKISSFRTTKHKTLEDKIEFINDNKSDVMFSCTFKDGEYTIYVIDTNILSLSSDREWEKCNKNYKSINNIVDVNIYHSMSDQVWYNIHLNNIEVEKIWKIKI